MFNTLINNYQHIKTAQMKKITLLLFLGLAMIFNVHSQDNVGIGVTNPDEKLEVAGKVFSNQGGFKFPDSTVQTTAAFNTNTSDAALPKLLGYAYVRTVTGPVTRDLNFKDGTSMMSVADLIPVYAHQIEIVNNGGGAALTPLKIVSDISIASPDLFQAITSGTVYPSGNLYLLEEIGGNEIVYAEIKLGTVKISAYDHDQIYVGNQQYAHLNGFALSYETIEMIIYFNGGTSSFCWDAMLGIACP